MNNKTSIDKNSLQIKKNTKREQVFTFNVLNPVTLMFDTITVETNFLDDFDNFGITVTHDTWLPENEGKIMYGVFDTISGNRVPISIDDIDWNIDDVLDINLSEVLE